MKQRRLSLIERLRRSPKLRAKFDAAVRRFEAENADHLRALEESERLTGADMNIRINTRG